MARIAGSIEQLRDEIIAVSPNQTLYIFDDTPQLDSDHDANAEGVVCALDCMQGNGLDLGAVAEQIRKRENPDLKYVIYNRRIASASSNPPWSWRTYTGSNPHTDHIHTSVGVGSDGHSKPPYDDRTSWGIAKVVTGGTYMLCKKGDKDLARDGKVTALQKLILKVDSTLLPKFGADGDYGAETSTALVALGVVGGDPTGNTYGPHEYAELFTKLAIKHAGAKGDKGDQGPKGDRGNDGTAAVLEVGTELRVTG